MVASIAVASLFRGGLLPAFFLSRDGLPIDRKKGGQGPALNGTRYPLVNADALLRVAGDLWIPAPPLRVERYQAA
jgi:hypothetical protein